MQQKVKYAIKILKQALKNRKNKKFHFINHYVMKQILYSLN